MATTRGQQPEEPTTTRAERVAAAIAGQGVVRRTVLYAALFASIGATYYLPWLAIAAVTCGVLLIATDTAFA